jgi:carboxypeptidase family protein
MGGGARRVGAEIVLHSPATKTNDEGVFTIASLPVGTYSARFSANEFARQQVDNLTFDVGQTRSVAIMLQLESVSSTVEVTSADSGLSTSLAEIGGVVHGSQAQDLPLNGRNYVSLVTLVPEAIHSGTGTQDQVRFAGLSAEDDSWHLDGVITRESNTNSRR